MKKRIIRAMNKTLPHKNEVMESRLGELFRVSFDLSSQTELKRVLKEILNVALSQTNARRGSIMLLDEGKDELYIGASAGLSSRVRPDLRVKLGDGIAGRVVKRGSPVLVSDVRRHPEFKKLGRGYRDFSFISVPLILDKKTISIPLRSTQQVLGLLNVSGKSNNEVFNRSDLHFLSIIANQAAISIENIRLNHKLTDHVKKLEVTHRQLQEMETHLSQANKIATMGRLANNITHELSQPLTSILGRVQLLLALSDGEKLSENIKRNLRIQEKECLKVKGIVESIQNFSRFDHFKLEPVSITHFLSEVRDQIEKELRLSKIELNLKISRDLPLVWVDMNHLKQVFLNIFTNAREAMPEGGKIYIKAKLKEMQGRRCQFAQITFRDTGPGIPRENLQYIFEPFFTTRKGKSVGLGLTVSYRMLQRMGGNLAVRSSPGHGATFILTLPIVGQVSHVEDILGKRLRNARIPAVNGVWVVDDRVESRRQLLSLLQKEGYQAIGLASGLEAIEILKDGIVPELIFLDLKMPELDGFYILEEVLKVHPDIKVVLISESAGHQEIRKAVELGAVDFIVPPFTPYRLNTLLARLRSKNIEKVHVSPNKGQDLLRDSYISTLKTLTRTIEAKDPYTEGHSTRVTDYAMRISSCLRLSEQEKEVIANAGKLHDIGKIAIPDEILQKPGKLTPEEYEMVKKHPVVGEKILEPLTIFHLEQPLVRYHHERYDGKGYPEGLKGETIPIGARILGIADAYDAMISQRAYRQALSKEQAKEELKRCAGSQFDPELVLVFLGMVKDD